MPRTACAAAVRTPRPRHEPECPGAVHAARVAPFWRPRSRAQVHTARGYPAPRSRGDPRREATALAPPPGQTGLARSDSAMAPVLLRHPRPVHDTSDIYVR